MRVNERICEDMKGFERMNEVIEYQGVTRSVRGHQGVSSQLQEPQNNAKIITK